MNWPSSQYQQLLKLAKANAPFIQGLVSPVPEIPYLFLGSRYGAENQVILQRCNIKAVLCLTEECQHYSGIEYLTIPIEEGEILEEQFFIRLP